jgi:hypothetical protein
VHPAPDRATTGVHQPTRRTWWHARRGTTTVHQPRPTTPDNLLVRIAVTATHRWRSSLAAPPKPLADGLISRPVRGRGQTSTEVHRDNELCRGGYEFLEGIRSGFTMPPVGARKALCASPRRTCTRMTIHGGSLLAYAVLRMARQHAGIVQWLGARLRTAMIRGQPYAQKGDVPARIVKPR